MVLVSVNTLNRRILVTIFILDSPHATMAAATSPSRLLPSGRGGPDRGGGGRFRRARPTAVTHGALAACAGRPRHARAAGAHEPRQGRVGREGARAAHKEMGIQMMKEPGFVHKHVPPQPPPPPCRGSRR